MTNAHFDNSKLKTQNSKLQSLSGERSQNGLENLSDLIEDLLGANAKEELQGQHDDGQKNRSLEGHFNDFEQPEENQNGYDDGCDRNN